MNKKQTPQAKIARKKSEKFTVKDIQDSGKVSRVVLDICALTCCCCCTAVALIKPIK